MFTVIRGADGSVRFETHVAPSEYTPQQAREVLEALMPVVAELRKQAVDVADDAPDPGEPAPVPSPAAAKRPSREEQLPVEA